jgi:hypothetical protein
LRAGRLGQGLRPQIGRADCVCVVDDRGPPGVVATHGHREAEREDEPDETEERGLEDAERLAQGLGVCPQPAPCDHAQQRRPEHDPEDDQPELEAAQAEEHRIRRTTSGFTG